MEVIVYGDTAMEEKLLKIKIPPAPTLPKLLQQLQAKLLIRCIMHQHPKLPHLLDLQRSLAIRILVRV